LRLCDSRFPFLENILAASNVDRRCRHSILRCDAEQARAWQVIFAERRDHVLEDRQVQKRNQTKSAATRIVKELP